MTTPQDYAKKFTVKTSAQQAFERICEVEHWWTKDFEGDSKTVGGIFTVRFGTTWKKFKVTEMQPGRKIAWEVIDCLMPWNPEPKEWIDNKISFEIENKDGQTQIEFTQLGLVPDFNCYEACSNAWNDYLGENLREWIDQN